MTKEQHQQILYGQYFNGVDAPLKGLRTYKQVESQSAFVNHLRVIGDMVRDKYRKIIGEPS